MPLKTFEKRVCGERNVESQCLGINLENDQTPSPKPDVVTRSPGRGPATFKVSRLLYDGATGETPEYQAEIHISSTTT